MLKKLTKKIIKLHHVVDGEIIEGVHAGIKGDVSGICGDVTGIRGNVSGIRGDVSDIKGNIDDCNLSPEERATGINIEDLISS